MKLAQRCAPLLFALVFSPPTSASPYELTYTGTFNSQDALNLASAAAPVYFSGTATFTIHAFFDTSTPSLLPPGPPFLGFVDYLPSAVTLDVGGTIYQVVTAATNPDAGLTVAIFDPTNVFNPGRWGVGLIADVLHDGAGIVGDFGSASPSFSASAVSSTVFTDYAGVGVGSGVCLSGSPPACPHAVTPWVLIDSHNVAWKLSLGNYEEDFPAAAINTASIAAVPSVPEPASAALALCGLIACLAVVHRRRNGV